MSRYTSRYVVVVIVVTKWGMISHKYKYKYMLIKTSEQKEPSMFVFLVLLFLRFAKGHEEILAVVAGDVLLELFDALRHQRGLLERKRSDLTSF